VRSVVLELKGLAAVGGGGYRAWRAAHPTFVVAESAKVVHRALCKVAAAAATASASASASAAGDEDVPFAENCIGDDDADDDEEDDGVDLYMQELTITSSAAAAAFPFAVGVSGGAGAGASAGAPPIPPTAAAMELARKRASEDGKHRPFKICFGFLLFLFDLSICIFLLFLVSFERQTIGIFLQ
jgi:hypothetical protein